jgi:hypothetical protein
MNVGPPSLWSSAQSFWLQIQRSWVRFPALPDFLNRCFENVAKFRYLETTITNQNLTQEEIKRGLKPEGRGFKSRWGGFFKLT